ncbi:hypothetical protein F5B20DRAFT_90304 [Whalleya microplaca]|nr:hypothetical protein F5B20DRAFT_90304 [Whalleya microplaca]
MAHARCLFSPARALHRVFLSDLSSSSSITTTTMATTTIANHHLQPPRLLAARASLQAPSQKRSFTSTARLQRIEREKKLADKEIPYRYVRIAAPEGGLSDPQPTARVLAALDLRTHSLVMVAPPPPSSSDDWGSVEAAICRIIDKAAAAEKEREMAMVARRRAVDFKELELNWAIAGHDLAHKLRRLRAFLDKGMKVEILLARKRGGREASAEEAQRTLEKIREAVAEVKGAKENRKMEGAVGGVARLFLVGPGWKKRAKMRKGDEALEQEQQEQEQEPQEEGVEAVEQEQEQEPQEERVEEKEGGYYVR